MWVYCQKERQLVPSGLWCVCVRVCVCVCVVCVCHSRPTWTGNRSYLNLWLLSPYQQWKSASYLCVLTILASSCLAFSIGSPCYTGINTGGAGELYSIIYKQPLWKRSTGNQFLGKQPRNSQPIYTAICRSQWDRMQVDTWYLQGHKTELRMWFGCVTVFEF